MRSRALLGAAVVAICAIGAPVIRAQQATSTDIAALLTAADKLSLALKGDEATARVQEALELATKRDDRIGVAMAHRQMGLVLARTGAGDQSGNWYEKALDEFEALKNTEGIVQALGGLVADAVASGDTAKARDYGSRALKLSEQTQPDAIRAGLLAALIQSGIDPKRSDVWNDEILQISERLGDRGMRAGALTRRGDSQFGAGDFVAARTSFEQAIADSEALGDIEAVAAEYLSLGRVFRAHGDYQGAMERYQKAIDLLEPNRQPYTLVQAINAKAVALGYMNRGDEALATSRQGLTLARESRNPVLIDFMEGNLAGGLLRVKRYEEAIPLLEAAIAKKPVPYIASYRFGQLAEALMRVGRFEDALAPANEAIRLERELKMTNELQVDLMERSELLGSLGRLEAALVDARECLQIIERIRTTLLPVDFLKRGYNDSVSQAYGSIVSLLSRLDNATESLEASEQGRSRAFLDLLSAREAPDAKRTTRASVTVSDAGRADLVSESIGKPLDLSGIAGVAGRLKATILSYWIDETAVLIWMVPPSGAPVHVRVPMAREQLASLVEKTTAAFRSSAADATTRGDQPSGDDLATLPMRGLSVMALSRDDKVAWRELYKTLIEPVRAQLPKSGRLIVVPHGPLFQLSFAALQNAAGRYLIEDYELSYAPSISVLDFTSRRQQAVRGNASSGWAVVGNPLTLPSVGGKPLPPLPGAAQEMNVIAGLAPKSPPVVRLEGARADEMELARELERSHPSVLHFATHGFVFDDPKQPPFLALNKHGSQPDEDGRLTLDEVYGLRLTADLVVLSACRSGSGQVSSDGVIGLTRGFFYAGAPSVAATFWDVTDAITANLMTGFYREYVKTHAKGASLRKAQLALLADLRAGKVTVTVGGRSVTLPEHPLLWAAFFLSGEP